jgi:uncharacterized protein YbbC (DUF1343 family)
MLAPILEVKARAVGHESETGREPMAEVPSCDLIGKSEPSDRVVVGLEKFLQSPPSGFGAHRWGLLANQASVNEAFLYSWDMIASRYPGRLSAIFTPQHGLWSEQQANMIESGHGWHERLGLPVHSLYSETRRPTGAMLDGIDGLLIDLQDVGTRVYTFVWTVVNCLRACSELGMPLLLLDRPNPLGGVVAEGPLVEPEFFSFVGGWSIPMRHGMTIGELAQLCNSEMGLGANLTVVPVQGWKRSMLWPATCRRWIAPSPNVPTVNSMQSYPGMVLLEGTNLSEGRGTTTPFEVLGAPFVDGELLVTELATFELPGVRFRPTKFAPTFDKWRGQSCGGMAIHVTDPWAYRPYATVIRALSVVKRLWPAEFEWLAPPYEYDAVHMPIDILSGSSALRDWLDGPEPELPSEKCQVDPLDTGCWWDRASRFVLYS